MRVDAIIGTAREFLTGKMPPEERQATIAELQEDERLTHYAVMLSVLLHPSISSSSIGGGFTLGDILVMDNLPLKEASDRGLKHMVALKRTVQKFKSFHG